MENFQNEHFVDKVVIFCQQSLSEIHFNRISSSGNLHTIGHPRFNFQFRLVSLSGFLSFTGRHTRGRFPYTPHFFNLALLKHLINMKYKLKTFYFLLLFQVLCCVFLHKFNFCKIIMFFITNIFKICVLLYKLKQRYSQPVIGALM